MAINWSENLTSAFNFFGHDRSTGSTCVWVGDVAITKALADSGKLDLRSRLTADDGADAGGRGVLTSGWELEV